jgi:hypothetical protein
MTPALSVLLTATSLSLMRLTAKKIRKAPKRTAQKTAARPMVTTHSMLRIRVRPLRLVAAMVGEGSQAILKSDTTLILPAGLYFAQERP